MLSLVKEISMNLHHYDKALNMAYAFGLLFFGYFIAKRIAKILESGLKKIVSRHHLMLISRGSFYFLFILFIISGLQHLGFNLSVLLGAAGVFTVAISFASQTAASNLISGIFLLFERPFKIGDNIEINSVSGVVESIDLLSTKLRTSDNKLVRIPNETLIKSQITNLNYFSIRRIDLLIRVGYATDLEKIKGLLLKIAKHYPAALDEPAPTLSIHHFSPTAIELLFMVWAETSKITSVKDKLQEEIKLSFEREGIEMPTPQIVLQK